MNPFRFKVSLRFHGGALSPSEIASQLGWPADFVHVEGQPRSTPTGGPLPGIYSKHYCCFHREPLPDELLSDMIRRLASELESRRDLVARVRATGGRAEFFVGWFTPRNSGDSFDHSLLGQLGELGLDLDLDVYCTNL